MLVGMTSSFVPSARRAPARRVDVVVCAGSGRAAQTTQPGTEPAWKCLTVLAFAGPRSGAWEAGQWVQQSAGNIDLFDFQLPADELLTIDGLDTGARGGPQPENITGQSFGMGDP
jgi:hypothetical protein